MTFPKRNTRTIDVDGVAHQWHLDDPETLYRWIVIRKVESTGRLLFLDWSLQDVIGPGVVRRGIDFGYSAGWNPNSAGLPMKIAQTEDGFEVLPDDAVFGALRRIAAGDVVENEHAR